MSNAYPIAWTQADEFLSTGGTSVYIKNPTESDIAPYVSYLTGHQNANINPVMGKFYSIALHGLNESIKNIYPNPQLRIALSNDNMFVGCVFYYEVLDQGDPFNWVEVWVDDGTVGAGALLMYLTGDQTASVGHNLCGNPVPNNTWTESRPYITKDSTTKWYTITAQQLIDLANANKNEALATQHFSKIMQNSLSWLEKGTN
jgi:hypothetical protein